MDLMWGLAPSIAFGIHKHNRETEDNDPKHTIVDPVKSKVGLLLFCHCMAASTGRPGHLVEILNY